MPWGVGVPVRIKRREKPFKCFLRALNRLVLGSLNRLDSSITRFWNTASGCSSSQIKFSRLTTYTLEELASAVNR